MVNLQIDDKQVAVPKETTIYDAAVSAGIRIPILCHDKKLKPFGGCRMCIVEVEQMKGRQVPSCTTPVSEGMIVRTSTPDIVKSRKMVLELLLLNHPIDCPVCDAAGDCDLQNLTYEYGVNVNRFHDAKFKHEIDYVNPLIERDMNRCILCGKCARICDEIVSFGAYTFLNRGIEAKVGTAFDGPLDCEFCGSCVSVCPVGALLSRPFKFKARWWALDRVKTVCSYCGTGCRLTLGVKENKVLTTIYDENQGFHNGQLCTRGRWGYQFINSEKRLTTPLVRKDGRLVPASWDEALEIVKERLSDEKGRGGDAVAGLVTPRLTNEELFLLKNLFKEGLGSDNLDHSAGFAHEALTAGAMESLGHRGSPSVIADIRKTDFLLVVKSDAYETHPVIGFEINLGVKRDGVDLRIVSDKKGKLSRLPGATTYIHRPASEAALFNAMSRVIIDEGLCDTGFLAGVEGFDELRMGLRDFAPETVSQVCGIPAVSIIELARDYARAEKALILLPLGLGYPGHVKLLAQALLNLAILTGRIGREGCGVLFLGEKNNSQGAADLGICPTAGGRNATAILDGCADGTIRTLYVIGENPVISYPGRRNVEAALDRVEFLIVQELFLTETAEKADVVLPACSFAEKVGTFTSAGGAVQRLNRVIRPLGEAWSDFEILNFLNANLGVGKPYDDPGKVFAEIAASLPAYSGLTYDRLGDEGAIRPVANRPRLVAVTPPLIIEEPERLALVTGSALNHCGTLSRFGEGPMLVCPEGYIELGRDDAKGMKIADGEFVTVSSQGGSMRLKAKVGSRMPSGVVFAPYHFGLESINGLTACAPVTWVTVSK